MATCANALLTHPVAGASWEGSAIESLIAAAPQDTQAYFFRTSAGAEVELLLAGPGERLPLAEGVEAFPLTELCAELAA